MPASRFAVWAGHRIESRVTGVTEPSNSSISAALETADAVTRIAGSKVTQVTPSSPSAIEVTHHPISGLPRKPIDDQRSNPRNPSNPQNEECPLSPNGAADPGWWHDFFEERAAHLEIDGGYARIEAEARAFNESIAEWHLRHSTLPQPGHCAGCGRELEPKVGLVLDRGVHVHFGGTYEVGCVIAYDRQSRNDAINALRILGVDPAAGFES
jgi:hypothetical protein